MAKAPWLPFAGLAGTSLDIDTFDLGHGVTISKTFAHLTAPFLMAFAPAEPGKPHPAPWVAVSGGLAFDIQVQLHVPLSLESEREIMLPQFVAWWITALIRFRVGQWVVLPVISSHPFSEAKDVGKEAKFYLIEAENRVLELNSRSRSTLTKVDLAWIRRHWFDCAKLGTKNSNFQLLVEAVDQSMFARYEDLALLWLWGGIEALFSPAKTELRFRISSAIACFLEPAGLSRMSLQKTVAKLYDSRSDAAHGRKSSPPKFQETYELARRITMKIIEDNHIPTHTELEAKLFGAEIS